jgi:hypothetical protein
MSLLLLILLIVAVLAIASAGWGYYSYRPVAVTEAPVSTGPSPIISIIGVLGLLTLVAFFVLWAIGGWHFDFRAIPPQ